MTDERKKELWDLGMNSIRELESERGVFASSRQEIYGCIFGRDSLITSLFLLDVYAHTKDAYLLQLVRKVLANLTELQGTQVNIESGEEPGKMIHEFRPDNHQHLTADPHHPWYLYPDGIMRNYDTVDATPLFLMAAHRYFERAQDAEFLALILAHVQAALDWLLTYADSNGDGLIDYQFHPDRTFGGLRTQSWMDSTESLFFEENRDLHTYSVAPIEVQGYAFAALSSWANFFAQSDPARADVLATRASQLAEAVNKQFVLEDGSFAFAIDGAGRPMRSMRSSPGHLLWATAGTTEKPTSVLASERVPQLASRLMQPDLFIPEAGIRTLSSASMHYEENSYHNGSIWPHDTMIVTEGLRRFGFENEARRVRGALLNAYDHFNTPIELFTYGTDGFGEYRSPSGQGACRVQAWSAAALLALLAAEGDF